MAILAYNVWKTIAYFPFSQILEYTPSGLEPGTQDMLKTHLLNEWWVCPVGHQFAGLKETPLL